MSEIEQHELAIGDKIAERYEILAVIGKGRMGAVYKCKHDILGRIVAIKTLQLANITDDLIRRRFEREARLASRLEHPNLISVSDFGYTRNGDPYLVMDFADGKQLYEILQREGHLEPERVINLFIQVCDGLYHAHQRGIMHRDLKPANILVLPQDGGEAVKIVDLGIAKIIQGEEADADKITRQGEVCGSPVYLSPEQCLYLELDNRTDIYSLGVCLYECLTGRPPLKASNVYDTLKMHVYEMPLSFAVVAPNLDIPKKLEEVVFRCLAKATSDRYETMIQVKHELMRSRKSEFDAVSINVLPPESLFPTSKKQPTQQITIPAPQTPDQKQKTAELDSASPQRRQTTGEFDSVSPQQRRQQTGEFDSVSQQQRRQQIGEFDSVSQQQRRQQTGEFDSVNQQQRRQQTGEFDSVSQQQRRQPAQEINLAEEQFRANRQSMSKLPPTQELPHQSPQDNQSYQYEQQTQYEQQAQYDQQAKYEQRPQTPYSGAPYEQSPQPPQPNAEFNRRPIAEGRLSHDESHQAPQDPYALQSRAEAPNQSRLPEGRRSARGQEPQTGNNSKTKIILLFIGACLAVGLSMGIGFAVFVNKNSTSTANPPGQMLHAATGSKEQVSTQAAKKKVGSIVKSAAPTKQVKNTQAPRKSNSKTGVASAGSAKSAGYQSSHGSPGPSARRTAHHGGGKGVRIVRHPDGRIDVYDNETAPGPSTGYYTPPRSSSYSSSQNAGDVSIRRHPDGRIDIIDTSETTRRH